jgi:hypothetical protein
MRKGKIGEQNGISGKESRRLCQKIPIETAGCHVPTCRELQPK